MIPRPRDLSIHTRLFLGFAITLVLSGLVMAAAVYLGMRYLPTYGFQAPGHVDIHPGHQLPLPEPTLEPAPEPSPNPRAQTTTIDSKEDVWATVLLISLSAAALVALLGLAASWFTTRRLLTPLHTITLAAAKAGTGNLSYRINAAGPPDELRRLADTFDDSLARLERSFDAHSRFAANASHELLTPLAATRTALQVAGQDPTGKELVRLAPMLARTNDRCIEIVTELLQLAAAEHAQPDPAPVDVAALVEEECTEAAARAEAADLSLNSVLEPDSTVPGNAALLRRLVHNLLDNALTHNEPQGWVRVTVRQDPQGAQVLLRVENSGPQVDPTTTARLFEPFYRANSRVRSDRSGHGLGLALPQSIARAHGGTITAAARAAGGLAVTVRLPAEKPG
ncbi:HAMP domain-containing sensor histidine kinase [Streptomyces sp. NPDC039016]|uniref:sensor histidine kinase n=1 Tax=Streptomyces sp. NPDC039016 TaxID=3154330 RepID=UPI0033F81217